FGRKHRLPVFRPARPTRIHVLIAEQDRHECFRSAMVCDTRLEASENLNPTRAAIAERRWTGKLNQLGSHADGYPNIRRASRVEAVEAPRGDAEHGKWVVVEMDRAVENGLVGSEAAPPERVAQDRDRMPARDFVVG